MSDIKVKNVHLQETTTGGTALILELKGRPGDEIEKICTQHQGKGYVTYVMDEKELHRLWRMATGIVAGKTIEKTDRLVEPVRVVQ